MLPHRRDILLVLLIDLAAISLAMATRTHVAAAILMSLATLRPLIRWNFPGERRTLMLLFLAIPFAFWLRALPPQGFSGFPFVDNFLLLGFYALTVAVYCLWLSDADHSRIKSLSGAILAMALSGTSSNPTLFWPLAAGFALAMLLEILRQLKLLTLTGPAVIQRASLYALTLLLLAGLWYVVHQTAMRWVPMANRQMLRLMNPRPTSVAGGFSRVGPLLSKPSFWDESRNNEVLLQAVAHSPPGHLRGAVFDQYRQGQWIVMEEKQPLQSQIGDQGRSVFDLGSVRWNEESPSPLTGRVYPMAELADAAMMPLGCDHLAATTDRLLMQESALTVRSPRRELAAGYAYYQGKTQPPPPTANDRQVPDDLLPLLQDYAKTFLPESIPAGEVAQRIELHFARYFGYRIGVSLTGQADPNIEFLTRVRQGHCEFFASCGTLLLRSQGIAARYVVGVVCQEPALLSGQYLARRKDAHAWVEYFDPDGRQWRRLDPTPASSRPQAITRSGWQQWMDHGKLLGQRLWNLIRYGGLSALLSLGWHQVSSLLLAMPSWVWLAILFASLGWVFRRNLLGWMRSDQTKPQSAHARFWQKKLQQVEKQLARHGLKRLPHQPVGDWLPQIRQAPLPPAIKTSAIEQLEQYQSHRFSPPSALSRSAISPPDLR